MALIEFKNLPDTTTPINAENLNNNFDELDDGLSNKVNFDELNDGLSNKVNLYKKSLPNGSTITFNGNNRAAYLISTTSNSAGIRGSWLLVTSSGSDTPINLSSSGSNISISSNNGVISIANNGNYGTNCFIVELADDSLNNTNWK